MIVNLTQHQATADQIAAGVQDLPAPGRAVLVALLTFDTLPDRAEIEARANELADLARLHAEDTRPARAMIGGASYLIPALEAALLDVGIRPVHAFSRRESADLPQPDGTVKKVAVFRHLGFVRASS